MKTFTLDLFPIFFIEGKKIFKANANSMYGNNMHFSNRVVIKRKMENYIISIIPKNRSKTRYKEINFYLYAPENMGAISVKNFLTNGDGIDRIKYRRWDLINFCFFWQKAIEDALVKLKYFEDDDIKNLTGFSWKYFPSLWKDRKIIVELC